MISPPNSEVMREPPTSANTYIGDMANKILNVSIKLKRPVTEKEMDLVIVPTISTVTGVVKK